MSVPASGTFTRSRGIISAIAKQLRSFTLKPTNEVTVTFDPFDQHSVHTRDFLFHISSERILSTNPNCVLKTEVLSNRGSPCVAFTLVNGNSVVFKSGNLTTLELLQLYNKHIGQLAPPEEPPTSIKTKSQHSKRIRKT